MGIIPAVFGSLVRWIVQPDQSKRKLLFITTFLISWLSVELAAASCAFQLAASNRIPLFVVLPAMLSYHAFIGIGEGLVTCLVFSFLLSARPDLLVTPLGLGAWKKRDWLFVVAGVALIMVAFIAPFASSSPDGLEKVAIEKGFEHYSQQLFHAIIPGYVIPGISNERVATSIAGILGVGVILILAVAVRRAVREKKQ